MNTENVVHYSVITRVSVVIGILLIPIALLALMDLGGGLIKFGLPSTTGQWLGATAMVAVLAGVAAGFTARSHHSKRRRLIHLIVAANGIVWPLAMIVFASVLL